jgi:hypothetical protein
MDVKLHIFANWALYGGDWSALRPPISIGLEAEPVRTWQRRGISLTVDRNSAVANH